jgi:hypothetical protein
MKELHPNHPINQRLEKLRKSYQFLVIEGDISPTSEAAILIKDEIDFLENGLNENKSTSCIENILAFSLFIAGFLALFSATVFAIYLILTKNLYI